MLDYNTVLKANMHACTILLILVTQASNSQQLTIQEINKLLTKMHLPKYAKTP